MSNKNMQTPGNLYTLGYNNILNIELFIQQRGA